MVCLLQSDGGAHSPANGKANHMGTIHETHPFSDTRSNARGPNLDADTSPNR